MVEEGCRCFCGLQTTCTDVDVESVDGVDVVHGVGGGAAFEASGCGVCGVFDDGEITGDEAIARGLIELNSRTAQ